MVPHDSWPMQRLIDQLRAELLAIWPCQTLSVSLNPVLSVSQFYEDACLPRHCADREHRSNFIGSDLMLRRQLADSMPALLRTLAKDPPDEVLLVCPGPVYHQGADGRLKMHHELEIWRLVEQDVELENMDELVRILQRVMPVGLNFRTRLCQCPYLVYAYSIEIDHQGAWMKIGHCGLVNPMLLIENGFDSAYTNALALNLDLDLCFDLGLNQKFISAGLTRTNFLTWNEPGTADKLTR